MSYMVLTALILIAIIKIRVYLDKEKNYGRD